MMEDEFGKILKVEEVLAFFRENLKSGELLSKEDLMFMLVNELNK